VQASCHPNPVPNPNLSPNPNSGGGRRAGKLPPSARHPPAQRRALTFRRLVPQRRARMRCTINNVFRERECAVETPSSHHNLVEGLLCGVGGGAGSAT